MLFNLVLLFTKTGVSYKKTPKLDLPRTTNRTPNVNRKAVHIYSEMNPEYNDLVIIYNEEDITRLWWINTSSSLENQVFFSVYPAIITYT